MKFALATIVPALLAASALAQTIQIGAPKDMKSVRAGSKLNVEVDRPDSLSGSTEVAIVIAVDACSSTTGCISPPDAILGNILYNGPYNPQFSVPRLPPHQNFTVTIPSTLPVGLAQLTVFHVALIGAGPSPFSETRNVTLKIHH